MIRAKAFTTCLVLILAGTSALAQTYTGLEPESPQYPVLKLQRGATPGSGLNDPFHPTSPSLPQGLGGVTIGGGNITSALAICYQEVKSETNTNVVAEENLADVQDKLFESAVNVATLRQRIQSRWFPSQLERETLGIINERMATHPQVQSEILMERCVSDSWKKLDRLTEDQQNYLREALDYLDYYLK